jgi:dienelactone hydrolase
VLRYLFIAAIVVIAGRAAAEPASFPSATVGNAAAAPEIKGTIYSPAGAGPWPAIVVMHGCGGVSARTRTWGKRLADWGYLALVLDSFGGRGVKAVCTTRAVVTPNMRVADIAGAIDFLAQRVDVEKGRFGLIGFSHGGSTAIRATQKSFDLARRGLVASVAYYPGCNPAFDREVDIPLLILIGDKDDWTRADRCRTLQASGFVKPDLVEAVYYPDAAHAFDSNVRDRTVAGSGGKQHRLAYDPIAAPDAEARTKAFLARYLNRP